METIEIQKWSLRILERNLIQDTGQRVIGFIYKSRIPNPFMKIILRSTNLFVHLSSNEKILLS